MADETFILCPDLNTYADLKHSKLTVEAQIPGVEKKDITVHMHPESSNTFPTIFSYK